MRFGWAIGLGICTALLVLGVSDGGLSGADHPPNAYIAGRWVRLDSAHTPIPGFGLVKRIALRMARGCGSPQTIDRSTGAQVILDLHCTAQGALARGRTVSLVTYERARDPRNPTQPGYTNADRYFVNQDVVVLSYVPTVAGEPSVAAAPFAYAIRRACHCGEVLKPGGL